MPNASLSIDGTEVISKVSGTITQTFPGPNHTFTVKAENSPIAGANYNTSDNATSDQLAIYNGATKLWGINESGWVQNPNLIGFQAGLSTGNITTSSTVVIVYNDVITGSNYYDNTTGRFTAPIDGKYFFITSNLNDGGQTRLQTALNVNGVQKHIVESGTAGGYQQSSNIGIFDLSAGDYVEVTLLASNAIYGSSIYSHFSGYLIG